MRARGRHRTYRGACVWSGSILLHRSLRSSSGRGVRSTAAAEVEVGAPSPVYPADEDLGGSGLLLGSRILSDHFVIRRLGVCVVGEEAVEDRIEVLASRRHLGGQNVSSVAHGRGDGDVGYGSDEILDGCDFIAGARDFIPAQD